MKETTFDKNLAVVILAAGCSSRLGQAKQLVRIDSKSLLRRQCELALKTSNHVYCVLGYDQMKMTAEIATLPITVIINQNWQQGMASSISAGIKALPISISAALIILVDQWQLTLTDLNKLIDVYWDNSSSIIQSEFIELSQDTVANSNRIVNEGRRIGGPPIIFPTRFFTNLVGLTGDHGARNIVQQFKSSTIKVPIANANADLDTPEQLKEMQSIMNG